MKLNLLLQYLLPHHILTRLMAKLANCRIPAIKNFLIKQYQKLYRIDLSEAVETTPTNYQTFNDFFTRALKPEARPIDNDTKAIISPVDGKIWQIGSADSDTLVRCKKDNLTIAELLADEKLATTFNNGNFAVLYLSPKDYHRVHMPLSGKLRLMHYIPGKLFSVNPKIVADNANFFARNERVVTIFDTTIGPMAIILVGAMIVGSIETVWAGTVVPHKKDTISKIDYSGKEITLEKGAELGRFILGSTVILLFPKNSMEWAATAKADSAIAMGKKLALAN